MVLNLEFTILSIQFKIYGFRMLLLGHEFLTKAKFLILLTDLQEILLKSQKIF